MQEEIGMVSGKIEKNGSIENMTVTGLNDWNLTYNKDTGVFNIYKAEGANTEDIINIEYKASSNSGTAVVTLSNLKLSTITYETKEISNISKSITIENGNEEEQQEEEQKEQQEEQQEQQQKEEQKEQQEEQQKQEERQEEQQPKENQQKTERDEDDNTIAPKILPKTGIKVGYLVIISVIIIIGIACFIRYKKIDK